MKKLILVICLLLFLTACTTITPIENNTIEQPVKLESLTLHTINKPYGVTSTCPNQTIESYVNIKMNKIVSGNLTLIEDNACNGQIKNCTGVFDITGKNNDKCWVLTCDISSPNKMQNSGLVSIAYLPCDAVKIQTNKNNINIEEELSWEIIVN